MATERQMAASSRGAIRHGLCATSPVIPGLETAADWDQHRATTIAGLAPSGHLEELLAERVALILWRIGRVARYERDVTADAQQRIPDDLAAGAAQDETDVASIRLHYAAARARLRALTRFHQLRSDAPMTGQEASVIIVAITQQVEGFDFRAFAVPGLLAVDDRIDEIPGWTVARIQQCIDAAAESTERNAVDLFQDAYVAARRWHNECRVDYDRLTRQLRTLRRERIIPQPTRLDHVIRYETHLTRQLNQTLAQLRQLQQARSTSRSPHRPPRTSTEPSHLPPALAELAVLLAEPPSPAKPQTPVAQAEPPLTDLSLAQSPTPGTQSLVFCDADPIAAPLPPSHPEDDERAARLSTTPARLGTPPAHSGTPEMHAGTPDTHPSPADTHPGTPEMRPGTPDTHPGAPESDQGTAT
jgi:hypothetical protein